MFARTIVTLGVVVACGAPPTPPIKAPTPPRVIAPKVIVVRVDSAAGRTEASTRVLRRVIATRSGRVELPTSYTIVDLHITDVISGTLDDPEYAQRPIGANALPVVLLDEAAFAAPESLDGFAGTWRLQREPDGALTVSAIGDTPFAPAAVAPRRAALAQARTQLRAATADQRLAGLRALQQYDFLELVPDVIATLDDDRSGTAQASDREAPSTVRDVAAATLHVMFKRLGDDTLPTSDTRAGWDAYWRGLVAPPRPIDPVMPGTSTELAQLAMNQSWPELVATRTGTIALGVTRLDSAPLDGHPDGIAVIDPSWKRSWLVTRAQDGLDAAAGPAGTAVLFANQGMTATWSFATGTTEHVIIERAEHATHAAIAASDTGYTVVYVKPDTATLFALALDATGQARGPATQLPLPSPPMTRWHRGIHPVALARTSGGWIAIVVTAAGLIAETFDDSFEPALSHTTLLANDTYLVEPRVVVSKDRALVAWRNRPNGALRSKIMTVTSHTQGGEAAPPESTGSEVRLVSSPVVLDDGGFAIAWIEAGDEVHVGRWNAAGTLVASGTVARGAAPFAVAVVAQGKTLVVVYEDETRYPYALVARRVELDTLR